MVGFCYLRVLGHFYECGPFGERVHNEVPVHSGGPSIHNKDTTLGDSEVDNLKESELFGC